MPEKIWYTYDEIHQAIRQLAQKIQASGTRYDAMIAIGGGGFIPARILRSFLNIPIYAITTAYYCNDQGHATRDSVQKIQWLDPMPESLKGKHVLVVDEVDDSRTTMRFVLIRRGCIARKNQSKKRYPPARYRLFQRPGYARLVDQLPLGCRRHHRTQRTSRSKTATALRAT